MRFRTLYGGPRNVRNISSRSNARGLSVDSLVRPTFFSARTYRELIILKPRDFRFGEKKEAILFRRRSEDVVRPARARRTSPECTSTRFSGGRRDFVGCVDRASLRVRTRVRCGVQLLYRRREGERFTRNPRVHREQRSVRAVGYYVLRHRYRYVILVRLGREWCLLVRRVGRVAWWVFIDAHHVHGRDV